MSILTALQNANNFFKSNMSNNSIYEINQDVPDDATTKRVSELRNLQYLRTVGDRSKGMSDLADRLENQPNPDYVFTDALRFYAKAGVFVSDFIRAAYPEMSEDTVTSIAMSPAVLQKLYPLCRDAFALSSNPDAKEDDPVFTKVDTEIKAVLPTLQRANETQKVFEAVKNELDGYVFSNQIQITPLTPELLSSIASIVVNDDSLLHGVLNRNEMIQLLTTKDRYFMRDYINQVIASPLEVPDNSEHFMELVKAVAEKANEKLPDNEKIKVTLLFKPEEYQQYNALDEKDVTALNAEAEAMLTKPISAEDSTLPEPRINVVAVPAPERIDPVAAHVDQFTYNMVNKVNPFTETLRLIDREPLFSRKLENSDAPDMVTDFDRYLNETDGMEEMKDVLRNLQSHVQQRSPLLINDAKTILRHSDNILAALDKEIRPLAYDTEHYRDITQIRAFFVELAIRAKTADQLDTFSKLGSDWNAARNTNTEFNKVVENAKQNKYPELAEQNLDTNRLYLAALKQDAESNVSRDRLEEQLAAARTALRSINAPIRNLRDFTQINEQMAQTLKQLNEEQKKFDASFAPDASPASNHSIRAIVGLCQNVVPSKLGSDERLRFAQIVDQHMRKGNASAEKIFDDLKNDKTLSSVMSDSYKPLVEQSMKLWQHHREKSPEVMALQKRLDDLKTVQKYAVTKQRVQAQLQRESLANNAPRIEDNEKNILDELKALGRELSTMKKFGFNSTEFKNFRDALLQCSQGQTLGNVDALQRAADAYISAKSASPWTAHGVGRLSVAMDVSSVLERYTRAKEAVNQAGSQLRKPEECALDKIKTMDLQAEFGIKPVEAQLNQPAQAVQTKPQAPEVNYAAQFKHTAFSAIREYEHQVIDKESQNAFVPAAQALMSKEIETFTVYLLLEGVLKKMEKENPAAKKQIETDKATFDKMCHKLTLEARSQGLIPDMIAPSTAAKYNGQSIGEKLKRAYQGKLEISSNDDLVKQYNDWKAKLSPNKPVANNNAVLK